MDVARSFLAISEIASRRATQIACFKASSEHTSPAPQARVRSSGSVAALEKAVVSRPGRRAVCLWADYRIRHVLRQEATNYAQQCAH